MARSKRDLPGAKYTALQQMGQQIKHYTYQASSFFSDDFPFAIRYTVNRPEDFNLMTRFRRDFWKIAYIISGEGNYVIGNLKFPFRKKTIIVVHPQANTTYEIFGREVQLYNIVFSHAFLDRNTAGFKDDFDFMRIFSAQYDRSLESPLFLLKADRRIDLLIRMMYEEFGGNEHNRQEMLSLQFRELLLRILRSVEHKSDHNPNWSACYVKEYLQQHFRDDVSQEELARRLNLTPERLCRLYREKCGESMLNTLNGLRLDHAAELLRSTSLPIPEVCRQSGFHDLRYFYRCFQRKFALSPLKYRRQKMGLF